MIFRLWRGWTESHRAADYPKHFRNNVLPELREITGFAGASLLKSEHEGTVGFLVQTRWTSMDAVKAFAGREYGNAVVEPEAVAALTRFDHTVRHYQELDT